MNLRDSADFERIKDRQNCLDLIRRSGLFDDKWYRERYSQQHHGDPLDEWYEWGWKMGRSPNLYFEPHWYLGHYSDVAISGINPLVHYILYGNLEDRTPSELFDPAWYRKHYKLPSNELCLEHYLRLCRTGTVNPVPEFDAEFYLLRYSDVAAARLDPFGHFVENGFRENRDPSVLFNTTFYRSQYLSHQPDVNPLLDFRRKLAQGVRTSCQPLHETTIPLEIRRHSRPGAYFEELRPLSPQAPRQALVLAYYLPQFHAIRENNNWWGKGFTEWTNLMRGTPRFAGHYQPRIPRDLGFYDLNSSHAMMRQIKMARDAGIGGFVFYFYWFNGKRLLEGPVERFLSDRSLDIPFCLMWANENWTRRWDGLDSDILISQGYRESDDYALVECFVRHFKDPRYIRLRGRPLLMIYRPAIIPDVAKRITRWREIFRETFLEDPILIMIQGFGTNDPRDFELDGAVEFPPHKICAGLPSISSELDWLDPDASSRVVSFEDAVKASLSEPNPEFPLIKAAFPGWDNDPRREGHGMTVQGATPDAFQAWLSKLIQRAQDTPFFGKPIVCLNAWNEWAEGAYLEPDVHFGGAFLNAVGRAISGNITVATRKKLLLVGLSADQSETSVFLLALARQLRAVHGFSIQFLLLEGGPLIADYAAEAPVLVMGENRDFDRQVSIFASRGFRRAILNTISTGRICRTLHGHEITTTLIASDLPSKVFKRDLSDTVRLAIEPPRRMIFSSSSSQDHFEKLVVSKSGSLPHMTVLPPCLSILVAFDAKSRDRVRKELNIPREGTLLLGVGVGSLENGFDLFFQVWRNSQSGLTRPHCVWFGELDRQLETYMMPEIEAALAAGTFHIIVEFNDTSGLFSAADAFLLTSRNDPLPPAVLQAVTTGLPSVAFIGSGWRSDFLAAHDAGRVVAFADIRAMTLAATQLSGDTITRESCRTARLSKLNETLSSFPKYAFELIAAADPISLQVSVAVLGQGSANYLSLRLQSIFNQTLPVREVVVLESRPIDDNLAVPLTSIQIQYSCLAPVAETAEPRRALEQWREATAAATGEYFWMANIVDDNSPDFLEKATDALQCDERIVLVICNSTPIDSIGGPTGLSYKENFDMVSPGLLDSDTCFEGKEFIARSLVQDIPLNSSSAIIWRRAPLHKVLTTIELAASLSGTDLIRRLVAHILKEPEARVAYLAAPLSRHRDLPSRKTK
jgi:hypothetical protein